MKLELKHLAPYLPYKLNGQIETRKSIFEVVLNTLHQSTLQTSPSIHGHTYCSFEDFKPILRPLSDLTKDRFWDYLVNYSNGNIVDALPWSKVNELLEEHYDVFGLIEKGLAIDKNTIK